MKIKKFAGGGITYLATTNRREEGAKQASSDSSKKNNDYIKKILDMVTESGIDSDVTQFINSVKATLDLAADPMGNDMTMQDILNIARQASLVKTNYTEYQKARESLDSQDAWNDVALDSRGNLYVYDSEDGNINTVSLSKLKENPGRYQVLNNSDIMSLRRNDKSMAFNTGILDNIMSSAGMTSIVNYAKDIIGSFKDTQISGYSSKTSGNINTGMQSIVSALLNGNNLGSLIVTGPDGLYKVSSKSTIADTHIQDALNYIKISMPENYRHKLRATAALNGYTEDAYLLTSLMANTGRELTATYEENTDPVTGKKKDATSAKEQFDDDTLAIRVAKGDLTQTTAFISPIASRASDSSMMSIAAWNAYSPQKDNKDPVYQNNLQVVIPQTTQFKAADTSQIFFGNQRLNPQDLSKIVWDGTSMVKRIALPIRIEQGYQTPDIDLLIKVNEANKIISENPGLTDMEKNQILNEIGNPNVKYDPENKRFICTNIGFFVSIAGYANDDILEIEDQSKPFLYHLTRPEGREIKNMYETYTQYGKDSVSKKEKPLNDYGSVNAGDFYYGNIYIPITDPIQGFGTTKDQIRSKSEFMHPAKDWEIAQNVRAAEKASNWEKYNFNN